LKKKKSTR